MSDVDDAIARAEDIDRQGLNGDPGQARADRILLAAEVRRLRGELNERLRRLEQRADRLTVAASEVPGVAFALSVVDDREEDESDEALEREIARTLNRRSRENLSGTPDLVLARHLVACLRVWEESVLRRDEWWGFASRIGGIIPAVDEP